MAEAQVTSPLFEQVGGAPTIERLVDIFYDNMDTLPEAAVIRAMHGRDLAPIRDTLRRYLGEWLGGPKLYSSEKGHPRLRQRHLPFKIAEAERDAWMLCMDDALVQTIADDDIRRGIRNALYKLADWMRNQPGSPLTPP